nr:hypothetical protein [Tanacetum cinerariifolium]
VKPINRVPSIKSKLKDTGKSNSPKSRWVPMSERVFSPQPDKIDLVANKRSSLVAEKIDVVKDKVDVVSDKASDALKNKLTGKGKKAVVGKDKDKPKNSC